MRILGTDGEQERAEVDARDDLIRTNSHTVLPPCEGLSEGLSRYSERGAGEMTADEAEAPQGSTASTENVGGENAHQAVCCLEPSQDENADTV
jgi:hypothetical protein